MERRDFNLVFKDEPDLGDWEIRLITDVSMREEEIEELVLRYAKRTTASDIYPSPVSIMDDLRGASRMALGGYGL